VRLCPRWVPTVAMATSRGGVGWLGRSLLRGVELGFLQNGAQRLGVDGGSGGRRTEGEGGVLAGGLIGL
jgi:hypothetical protein